MKIWQRNFTIAQLNEFIPCTAMAALDIEFTEFGDDYLKARMPVTDNSSQPMGYLHGGASALLAESVASMAGNMCCELDYACLGQEFNCNHLRSARIGDVVEATAKPVHLGRKTQVWQVDIVNAGNGKLLCCARITMFISQVENHRKPKSEK
jgi:1,4-dihydroxy-2-naphthoyl-CoA hydrolase